MLFMTIPTAGNSGALLEELIESCGLPRSNIVLVATRPNLKVPSGVTVIEDLGEINIQRWWLRGIDESVKRGAKHVAVVNDDISLTPDTLQILSTKLITSGAAVASPSRPPFSDGLHKRRLVPYEPRLWGSLWVLNARSGLRPDIHYRWWFGDNDLDIRARKHHGGVVLASVSFEHHNPGQATFASPELKAIRDLDAVTFESQYRGLLRRSRMLTRVRKFFSVKTGAQR